jgi:hypothetical protein
LIFFILLSSIPGFLKPEYCDAERNASKEPQITLRARDTGAGIQFARRRDELGDRPLGADGA